MNSQETNGARRYDILVNNEHPHINYRDETEKV